MSDEQLQSTSTPMTVGKGIKLYALCLLVLMLGMGLLAAIAIKLNIPLIFAVTFGILYLYLGFYLNQKVLRELIEWHPMHNTLANISSAKFGMIALWILRYPMLFIQLLVTKHL